MPAQERKLYLGGRLRRLRRELGLNQSAMAAEIAISPSYLNHLERNQRPVTAQVLLRLAETYDVNLRSFAAEGGEGTGTEQLAEIFGDPMFADLGIPRYELLEVATMRPRSPTRSRGSTRRWSSAASTRRRGARRDLAGHARSLGARPHPGAAQLLRLYRGGRRDLAGRARRAWPRFEPIRRRLKEGFGIETRVVPPELLDSASQHYDYHRSG
jgi:transcriptional regulator with XRE-family HTH domain